MSRPKLYVLVRGDLSRPHRAVQAGHAVAEWCGREHNRFWPDSRTDRKRDVRWWNETLVYLQVADEAALVQWQALLGDEAVVWREPHWDYQMTAIAHFGKHEAFEDLPLMR